MTMKSALSSIGTCLIVLPWIVGCGGSKSPVPGPGMKKGPQKVTFAKARQEEIIDYVDLVSRLKADQSVEIRSRVSGFLEKAHFTDGQRVKEGDLLFSIEPEEYDAAYKQAKAQISVAETQLALAEKTLERSKRLMDSQAISLEEFDEDAAAVAKAAATLIARRADAARVELDVKYTKVVSPLTGRVDRALLDDGNFVTGGLSGGTVLTTVVSDRPIKAVANVDENIQLRFLRRRREVAGDAFEEPDKLSDLNVPCYLKLQDEEGFPHKGVLEYAAIMIDSDTGTSRIRAVFENKTGLLKSGMFARLKLPLSDPHTAVLVPDSAIGTDQATKFVYVIDDQNKVEHRAVTIGERRDSMRVVLSGIKPDESVVVAGLMLIQPGVVVDPIPQSQ